MDLSRFPRRRYLHGKTPIEPLLRLSERLGGPHIYIKRDDMMGLSAGGNKTRKLEFLMAEAISQNADTIITCGAVQSNHCRLTLAAAVKEGLACHLVIEERVADSYDPRSNGNNFLFHLLGVSGITVVPGGTDMMAAMEEVAQSLTRNGARPYIIPGGGSNALGAAGYAACAQEILEQAFDMGVSFDAVVCASGSGGTHSGLLTGFRGHHADIPVYGINVKNPTDVQTALIAELAEEACALLDVPPVQKDAIRCLDQYVGPGYSLPTAGMVEAVDLLAKSEGILLDPVYTGKAMAGLLGLVREGAFSSHENVLFLHTGGSPALYAYTPLFFDHWQKEDTLSTSVR
ncbi:MAG: D-cysteine desulfhydrase [Sulfobacillus acidophilus]|uniref:D-cysteine desulfhydrase n=1 Tax=Sulfobacillus acidophilus TaxID=53633 RepID=A0A2T2WJR1_9FIRM|nr:MAG: D-cysteine desulfhydrase [Sulfobacillus acidophilus]